MRLSFKSQDPDSNLITNKMSAVVAQPVVQCSSGRVGKVLQQILRVALSSKNESSLD